MSYGIVKYEPMIGRLSFYNTRNGYEDFGKLCNGRNAVDECLNCHTETMFNTVSTHFCPSCGALFNYWGGGGNKKYEEHHKKYDDKRRHESYLESLNDFNWYD